MIARTLLQNIVAAGLIAVLCAAPTASLALTPDQALALKKAGVSEETIQMMIRQEEAARGNPDDAMGRREVRDAQGNTVIVYSTGRSTRPAGDADPEKIKLDNAWKMFQNMIIDQRSAGGGGAP